MHIEKGKILRLFAYIIYALFAIMVFVRGIETTNDSASYIGMSSFRGPLYPLLIRLLFFIGGNNYKIWLLCFQIIFGAFGIYIYCSFFYRFFKLKYWLTFILSLSIASPYFFSSTIANLVMTEAISYPLILIAIRYLTESVFTQNLKSFTIYLICCIPLILIRGQF